jgi:CheY-like chemotaxis protein
LHSHPDTPPVRGDSERLRQTVSNLLSNAIKFTPQGGRIEVRLEGTDSQVRFTVHDTGIGIEPDFLPRVFDRFRQANTTSTDSRHGLGLGLAIAHRLVELHGGTIQAESPGPGQGATFVVTLPAAAPGEVAREEEMSSRAALEDAARLEGARVLLVEDDTDTRNMLALTLRRCGAEVVAASSAGEALEAIERLLPDVLVSDISMPGEDGYELIRKVRALEEERGRHLPALALTAYAGEEDRRRALSAGFQMHLAKPVEPAELSEVIKKLLGKEKEAISC